MDIAKVDPQAFQKIWKRHFLGDIEKSFEEVTPIDPEPHHFKISQQIQLLEASNLLAKLGRGW